MLQQTDLFEAAAEAVTKAPTQYCIMVDAASPCWIADWAGDPGRTLIKKHAKVFATQQQATEQCQKLKKQYPNRNFTVHFF
jgi:hypothetical protein